MRNMFMLAGLEEVHLRTVKDIVSESDSSQRTLGNSCYLSPSPERLHSYEQANSRAGMDSTNLDLSYYSRPDNESRVCSPESFRHGGRRGRYRLEEFGLPADERFEDPAELGEALFLRDVVELEAMQLAQPARTQCIEEYVEDYEADPEEDIDQIEEINLDDTPAHSPSSREFFLRSEFTQPYPPPPTHQQPSPQAWSPREEIPAFEYHAPRRPQIIAPQQPQLEQIPMIDVDSLTQYTNPSEKFRAYQELMSGRGPGSATCPSPPPRPPSPPPAQPGPSRGQRGVQAKTGARSKISKPKLVQPPMRAGTSAGRTGSSTSAICDSIPTHLGGIKLSRAARLKMQMQQDKEKADEIARKKAEQREEREAKKWGRRVIKKKEEPKPKSKSIKDHIADMKATKRGSAPSKKSKSKDELFKSLHPAVLEFLVSEFLNTSNPPDQATFVDIMTEQIVNNTPSTSCQDPTAQARTQCRAQATAQEIFSTLWNPAPCAQAGQPSEAPAQSTEKVTQVRIDGEGLDCIKETIIELSEVENGELNTQTKHIVTHRDPDGNVSSHVTESSSYSQGAGPSQLPETQVEELPLTPRRIAQRERQQIEDEFNRYDVIPPNYLVDNLLSYVGETEMSQPVCGTEVPQPEATQSQRRPRSPRYIPQHELPHESLSDLSLEMKESSTSNVCDDDEDLEGIDIELEDEVECIAPGDPYREVADFYQSPAASTGAPCENLMQFGPQSQIDEFRVCSPPRPEQFHYEPPPVQSAPIPMVNIERLKKWTTPSEKFRAYKDIMSGRIPACSPPPEPAPRQPSPRQPSPPAARQPVKSRGRGTKPKAVQPSKKAKAQAPKVCEPMPTHVGGVKLTRSAQLRLQKQKEKKKEEQLALQKAQKKAEKEALKRGRPIKKTESKETCKAPPKSMQEFIAERKKQNLPMIKAQAQAEKRLTNLIQGLTDEIAKTADALKRKKGCPMPSPKTKAALKKKLDELKAMKQQTQADLDAVNVGELPTATAQTDLIAERDENLPCTSAQAAAAAAARAQNEANRVCEPQTLAEARAQMEAEAAQWTPYEGEDEELPVSIKLQHQILDLGVRNTLGPLMLLPHSDRASPCSPTQELLDYEQEERRSCQQRISRPPVNLSMIAEEEEEVEEDLVGDFERAEREIFGSCPTQEPDEQLVDEILEAESCQLPTNIIQERYRSPSPLYGGQFPEQDVADASCILDESSDGYIADISQSELHEESFELHPALYQDTPAEIDTNNICQEPEAPPPRSPCPRPSTCPRTSPPTQWSPRDEIPPLQYNAPRRSPILSPQPQAQLEQIPMFDVNYLNKYTDPCEKFGVLKDLTTGRVPVSSTRTPPPRPISPPQPPPRQPTPPGPSKGRRGVRAKTVAKPKLVQPPMRAGKPTSRASSATSVCEPMPTHLGGVKLTRSAQLRMQKQQQQKPKAASKPKSATVHKAVAKVAATAATAGEDFFGSMNPAVVDFLVTEFLNTSQPPDQGAFVEIMANQILNHTSCAQPSTSRQGPTVQAQTLAQAQATAQQMFSLLWDQGSSTPCAQAAVCPPRQKSPSPVRQKSPSPRKPPTITITRPRSPPIEPNYYSNQLLNYERELLDQEMDVRRSIRPAPEYPQESLAEVNEPCMGLSSPVSREYPAFGSMAHYVPSEQQIGRTTTRRAGHRMSSFVPDMGGIAEEDICETDSYVPQVHEQYQNISDRVRLNDPLLYDVQNQMQNLGVGNVFCPGTVYDTDTDEEVLAFEEAERNARRSAVSAGEMPGTSRQSAASWMPDEEEELPVSIKLQYQMLDLGMPNSFGPLYTLPGGNCLSPHSPNNEMAEFLAAEARAQSPTKFKRAKRPSRRPSLPTIVEQATPESPPCPQQPTNRLTVPQPTASASSVRRPPTAIPLQQRTSRPTASCAQPQRSQLPSTASTSRVAMARQQAAGRVSRQQPTCRPQPQQAPSNVQVRSSTSAVSGGTGASRPAARCVQPQTTRSQLPTTASASRVAMARQQAAGRVRRPSQQRASTTHAQQPAGGCPVASPRR